MTRTSRRLASTAAAAGLALVVLTGCGNAPVRAGAAATVGDTRITTTELQGYISRGLADPQAQQQLGADKAAYQRQTLGRLINHQVLTEAARRSGVTVTEGEVDKKLADFQRQAGGAAQLEQQAAQNGIAKPDLRRFIDDVVLNQALGDKLTASLDVPAAQLRSLYAQNIAQYDQVHAAHILVPTKAQADAILAKVKADPGSFAAQAAQASTDASNKDKGGDLGFAGRGQFVKEFEAAIFAAQPGSFLEVKTQFGFHVVHVIERRTTTLAEATPDLRRGALQQQRDQLTSALLTKVAKDLGVTVNPRFGRWDGSKGSVVQPAVDKNSVSSPAPSPAAGSQAPAAPAVPSPAGQ
ncbi:MAG: PpiC-type peptidyl-prolyl cis-trans isomerase [Frankiales bacterium]|nr:PpiC-type peptidyl-prolyl cis-trans isomerase [Frankiales bacterium]